MLVRILIWGAREGWATKSTARYLAIPPPNQVTVDDWHVCMHLDYKDYEEFFKWIELAQMRPNVDWITKKSYAHIP